VLGLALVTALLLRGWMGLRRWLRRYVAWSPAVLAVSLAAATGWFATRPEFQHEVTSLRTLVGGQAEAERVAIGHQVYAAYRRSDLVQLELVLDRARVYDQTVREAAAAFDVDPEVLMGVGAAESAFYPRDSRDGGRGLFQITVPPKVAVMLVQKRLGLKSLDPLNQRHNAYVAAATLKHYLAEMRGDLFLGLLAYNIGPRNGGLRSIMQQYGARDFVTIQPYLQHLPRDYPIRVLSAALAYRLWRTEGKLPRYEDGDNARRVQSVGIPGLQPAPAARS
jgi:soluble lytic murein transglycosylase-like protein